MKPNRTLMSTTRHRVLAAFAALACTLSLAGCVEGTPLEGTPLEGPLNTIGEYLEGPLGKVSEFVDGLFGGPTVEEARAAKAAETAPVLTGDQLVREGYLTVGIDTSTTSVPFVIEGDDAKLSGIDIDVASALAGELGLKVAFVEVDDVDSALAAGVCDVVMSTSADGVTTSTVVGSYYETAAAFFHVGEAGVVSAEELENMTVGLQEGSVSQSLLGDTNLTMEQATYQNLNDAFDGLVSGEVDFVLCDAYPGAFLAGTLRNVSFAGALNAPTPWGIAAAAGKTELQAAVKDALDTVTANGEMDVIRTHWLGGMPSITPDDVIAGVTVTTSTSTSATGTAAEGDGSTAGANAVTVG